MTTRRPRTRRPSRRPRAHVARRFPRLKNLGVKARLQVEPGSSVGRTEAVDVGAHIRDLSPEGACVDIDSAIVLQKHDNITLRLNIDSAVLDIPTSLAWMSKDGGVIHLGLQLRLEVAPVLVRTRYARWIVNAIQSSGVR